jgi:hypothetical protein
MRFYGVKSYVVDYWAVPFLFGSYFLAYCLEEGPDCEGMVIELLGDDLLL